MISRSPRRKDNCQNIYVATIRLAGGLVRRVDPASSAFNAADKSAG